ncbi:thk-1, partial [Pristionchus pacificus]
IDCVVTASHPSNLPPFSSLLSPLPFSPTLSPSLVLCPHSLSLPCHSNAAGYLFESKGWSPCEMMLEMRSRGHVSVILGPMFSGKTTELLRLHERHVRAQKKCLLVKYAGDTRYDKDCVATHDRKFGTGATLKAERLAEVTDKLFDKEIEVVSIDEGQFFDDLEATVAKLALAGKIVYVAALNGDFSKKPFPQIAILMPHADEVTLLKAVCECGCDANFTFRVTTDKKVVVIGGEDSYKAVCRDCYEKSLIERDAFDENVARPSTVESEKRKAKAAPFEENESAKRLKVA